MVSKHPYGSHKVCPECNTSFISNHWHKRFCSDRCKGSFKYTNRDVTTESQYKNISGNWKRYLSRLIGKSKGRENLTVEILLEVLKEQKYKCALSGVELTCKLEKGVLCITNATVDRKEAGGPYVKENIQLVCRAVNGFRTNTKLDEFIWWCNKVTEYNNGR